MEQNIEEFALKFTEIKNLNWIEGTSNGKGNVGITFENIIGKERENSPIADYNGIEIKTSLKYNSRLNITLFSATFDGPYIFGTQYLKDQYGWSDKVLSQNKMMGSISGKNGTQTLYIPLTSARQDIDFVCYYTLSPEISTCQEISFVKTNSKINDEKWFI